MSSKAFYSHNLKPDDARAIFRLYDPAYPKLHECFTMAIAKAVLAHSQRSFSDAVFDVLVFLTTKVEPSAHEIAYVQAYLDSPLFADVQEQYRQRGFKFDRPPPEPLQMGAKEHPDIQSGLPPVWVIRVRFTVTRYHAVAA